MFAIKYAQNVQSNFVMGKCSVGDCFKGKKGLTWPFLTQNPVQLMGAEEEKQSAQKSMVSVIKKVLDCAITVCSIYGIFLTSSTFCQSSPWHSQDGLKMGKPECCLK